MLSFEVYMVATFSMDHQDYIKLASKGDNLQGMLSPDLGVNFLNSICFLENAARPSTTFLALEKRDNSSLSRQKHLLSQKSL